MPAASVVTGISPKDGPPGTHVIIRGEHFGNGPHELVGLTICDCDCLLSAEWKSPNKVIALSGPKEGRGDIIITTKSGGTGTCTVQFRGYRETVGSLKESAVWVNESHILSRVWNRKRTMSPSDFQQEDPLGLSDEGQEKKFPEDDLLDLFPNGSGDLGSENFVAAWYVLENHHATTFDDLKAGLNYLRRKVDTQKEGQLSFLKANVGSVMDQLDTLTSMKTKFEEDKAALGVNPTGMMEEAIIASKDEADKLFQDVLGRKDRADSTRNALNVLQRFKFLFNLPVSIERNIQKGDYDVVINDYARAKSLFGDTEVQVFQKFYNEVEKCISGLREMLSGKLQEMPMTLDEQKRIIRNLVNLETSGDPAWDCISCQYNYISKLLLSCKDEHIAQVLAAEDTGKSSKLLTHMTPPSSKFLKGSPSIGTQQDLEAFVPQAVLFIEELTGVLSTAFPDLWKLGQAYFTGELHIRVDPDKQLEFKHMVLHVIELFSNLVRAAIVPQTLDRMDVQRQHYRVWPDDTQDCLGAWLPQCLRYVRTCYASLLNLDLPGEALDIVKSLIFDIRQHCLTTLLRQTMEDVGNLHTREMWEVEVDDEYGSITQLPLLLESIVCESVQLVKETTLISEQRESDVLENNSIRTNLTVLLQNILTAFADTLETVASTQSCDISQTPLVAQMVSSPQTDVGRMSGEHSKMPPSKENRLLITLSNCNYTLKYVLPRLKEVFDKHGYPDTTKSVNLARKRFIALDKGLFEAYMEQKCDPLVGILEPSMYVGRFDWYRCKKPSCIRSYIKEILMNMIAVHAEVHSVSPLFVKRVLLRIVEAMADELSRLMSCVPRFSHHGSIQARADLMAVQEALQAFMTPSARNSFKEAMDAIPSFDDSGDKRVIEDLLNCFKSRMRFQLMCFAETSCRNS